MALGAQPRMAASQVWRWVSTKPGMTIRPLGVDHLGVGVDLRGDLDDRVPLDEDVALRQVAEVGVDGQDGAATQQKPVGHWDSSSSKSDLMSAGA